MRLYSQLSAVRESRLVIGGEQVEAWSLKPCSQKESEQMSKFVSRFVKDESGATAIEYGLIAALIAVVLIGVLGTLGGNLNGKFQEIADGLNGGGE
jgi:pilus assembly protein Flp/PilA